MEAAAASASSASNSTIGQTGDTRGRHDLFQQRELGQQVGIDPVAGFVARPKAIAEGLDYVIGRDAKVGGAAPESSPSRT